MILEKPVKILIADDYFLIREGLKKALKSIKNIEVVGEIQYSEEIASKVQELSPDILLIEINLCDKSLKELVGEISKVSPFTKIMAISDCTCSLPVIASIKAGISGFIRKNVSRSELLDAINTIVSGHQYFSKDITNILIKSFSDPRPMEHKLSGREIEILGYICKGLSTKQISDALFISEETVATHKRNMRRKACVNKTSDLILWALKNNIIVNN